MNSCFALSSNKGETAVHGCHRPGDMVVRMCKVLAIPWYVYFSVVNWYCLKGRESLAQKFDRFQTLRKNSQQQATTCNWTRVCKWTQHVTYNNVGSCWPTILCPFARGFRVSCNISRWWSRQHSPDMGIRSRDKSDSPLQMRFASQVVCPLQKIDCWRACSNSISREMLARVWTDSPGEQNLFF